MNDRFKFRAWNKKRKKMYEVLHLHLTSYSEGEWATVKGWCCIEQKDIHIQIQPKDIILMQCTGLKDSTGKLIFEGDITEHDWCNEPCVITYFQSKFVPVPISHYKDKDKPVEERIYGFAYFENNHYTPNSGDSKIIGNIYENIELLES